MTAKMSSPRTLEFTLPGGKPTIATSGDKSSVWQHSDMNRRRVAVTYIICIVPSMRKLLCHSSRVHFV